MKKNIVKFFCKCFSFTIGGTLIGFLICSLFIHIEMDSLNEKLFVVKILVGLGIVSGACVFAMGLFAFIVKIDSGGIRRYFFSQTITWSDIVSVRIIGFDWLKLSRKLILTSPNGMVEIDMFIFNDQEVFLKELKQYLPWADSLQLTPLPSQAIK